MSQESQSVGTQSVASQSAETKPVVTKSDLLNGFRQLGIQAGMAVEVHSSLSAFGWVEGGADTVIDVLEELLTEQGTLVMPSFNHAKIYAKGEIYDPRRTPTMNGKIPDTFWRRENVFRGLNPTHPYAAWGKNAKRYVDAQQTGSGSGKGSPLDLMWQEGGYVLLLGTGYRPNTFHHFVEQNEGTPCLTPVGEQYPILDYDGNPTVAHTFSWRERLCPLDDITPKYVDAMRKIDHRVVIGKAECIFYAMREGYPIIADGLRTGADGYPPCSQCPIRPRVNEYTIHRK